MARKHWADQTIDDLAEWMTATKEHLIQGFYDGDRTPGAADVPGTQRIAHYAAKWFPNGPGAPRDEAEISTFIEGRGEAAYARTLLDIDRMFRQQMNTAPPPSRPAEPTQAPPEGY